jgi:hypothetical protein
VSFNIRGHRADGARIDEQAGAIAAFGRGIGTPMDILFSSSVSEETAERVEIDGALALERVGARMPPRSWSARCGGADASSFAGGSAAAGGWRHPNKGPYLRGAK